MNKESVFTGCIPALMTPCDANGKINYDQLVATAQELIDSGMSAVVYCGSMGDWPLLTDAQRQQGVKELCSAGIPVIVGTGAQNSSIAVEHTIHAANNGAVGLMVIPRVLSRGNAPVAQRNHFSRILEASDLPAVIYNSPYYGFETKADLFFQLRSDYKNLIGFKEFGGAESLSYAAENITNQDSDLTLMVGVDTQVYHGFVNCGAQGAITGVGNALPKEVLRFVELSKAAAQGNATARRYALELSEALTILSTFDEGPDLVLYYKELMTLEGKTGYEHQIDSTDSLTTSQRNHIHQQWKLFRDWWQNWDGAQK